MQVLLFFHRNMLVLSVFISWRKQKREISAENLSVFSCFVSVPGLQPSQKDTMVSWDRR